MQTQHVETTVSSEDALFFTPKKKSKRSRKWQQIEELKSRQRLRRELKEIDQSFDFALTDLI